MAQTQNQRLTEILKTTQGKTYTVAIITVLLIGLMMFLAIRPAFLSITNQSTQNEAKQLYLDDLTTKENNLKTLAQQENQYTDAIAAITEYFPDKANDEFITANIAHIASKYNCTLKSLTFGKAEPLKEPELIPYSNLVGIPVNISFRGSLQNLQLVNAHLEAFPATIVIKDITYTNKNDDGTSNSTGNGAQNNLFVMNLAARYYYFNTGK